MDSVSHCSHKINCSTTFRLFAASIASLNTRGRFRTWMRVDMRLFGHIPSLPFSGAPSPSPQMDSWKYDDDADALPRHLFSRCAGGQDISTDPARVAVVVGPGRPARPFAGPLDVRRF